MPRRTPTFLMEAQTAEEPVETSPSNPVPESNTHSHPHREAVSSGLSSAGHYVKNNKRALAMTGLAVASVAGFTFGGVESSISKECHSELSNRTAEAEQQRQNATNWEARASELQEAVESLQEVTSALQGAYNTTLPETVTVTETVTQQGSERSTSDSAPVTSAADYQARTTG